jgi:hypothetical protein
MSDVGGQAHHAIEQEEMNRLTFSPSGQGKEGEVAAAGCLFHRKVPAVAHIVNAVAHRAYHVDRPVFVLCYPPLSLGLSHTPMVECALELTPRAVPGSV